MPDTVLLTGTATDDGNPAPPALLTTTWSLASGPAAVTFSAPNALSTTATFTVPGVYTIRLSAFDGQVTTSDDVLVTVNAPAGSGTGLLAQYFNDAGSGIYFTALVLTRTDPTVDFDWADASPDPVGAGRQLLRAVERTGDGAGHGQLHVHDVLRRRRAPVRERAAGRRQLDRPSRSTQNSGSIALTAGQKYDIRMDYYDRATQATARLSWAYPGQNTQIVPQWALYPAPPVNQPPAVNAGTDQVDLRSPRPRR